MERNERGREKGEVRGGRFICPVCGQERRKYSAVLGELLHGATAELIEHDHPQWDRQGLICLECVNRYRADYVEDVLRRDKGDLDALENEVIRSMREHELVSENINEEFEQNLSAGERIADRVASFGGSWTFIMIFGAVLGIWITINVLSLFRRPFDPYPFILLNLVLSCVAAIQAPVIMMSQNRQADKDRLRAAHDYQVNLKAELEIRHLQSKLDQLLSRHWQRLLEVQRIQTELLEEISRKGRS